MDDAGLETEDFKAKVRANKVEMVDREKRLTREFLDVFKQPDESVRSQLTPLQVGEGGGVRDGSMGSEV